MPEDEPKAEVWFEEPKPAQASPATTPAQAAQ